MLASTSGRASVLSRDRARPQWVRSVQQPLLRPSVSSHASGSDKVADYMTKGALQVCKPEDSVDSVLEKLVASRISGMPVVDEQMRVIGVVSDFDLLALDTLGRTNDPGTLFPQADVTWQAFKDVKKLLAKSSGKLVKDVMTKSPLMTTPETSLNEATSVLLQKKLRRLPVVDADGKLVGLLSRGNIVRAALAARQQQAHKEN